MGFPFVKIVNAVHNVGLSFATSQEASIAHKSYCAVYVGESQRKRLVIPIAYLNQPFFKDLLSQAEEEFGYNHPMGGLTAPCSDDTFINLISHLH